jgi:hypothetical protein
VRWRGFVLASLLASLAAPTLAQQGCPPEIARDLAAEAPVCELNSEGELRPKIGAGPVVYGLYRWVSGREPAPSALYDSPPYRNTAVTVAVAGAPAFWSGQFWLGVAWFDTPHLVRNPEYGEFLVVPGRYTGTGSFVEDYLFIAGPEGDWTRVEAAPFNPETGRGWLEGLKAHLPAGHGLWKGIRVDYATLTGTSPVWRDGDGNCCPSGGSIWFRLRLARAGSRLEVAEARYAPPEG